MYFVNYNVLFHALVTCEMIVKARELDAALPVFMKIFTRVWGVMAHVTAIAAVTTW